MQAATILEMSRVVEDCVRSRRLRTPVGRVIARWFVCGILGLALAGLAVVYIAAFRAQPVGLFHDDGIYAVTAKALAEGRGYRIISLPDQIPQTKYPILFPALLAGIWKLEPRFPENALWLKLV